MHYNHLEHNGSIFFLGGGGGGGGGGRHLLVTMYSRH